MEMTRLLKHLLTPRWAARRAFPSSTLAAVTVAVEASERLHSGELRFVVEAALDWPHLIRGTTARERALQLFSELRVWDTEHNSGVLIYVLLADRQVEIIADRGIHRAVGDAEWAAVCGRMEAAFGRGEFEKGAVEGVREVGVLLTRHFPAQGENPDELPNQAVVL